ncbi:uncharacterized protein SOCEGT47_074740 [Sorangium cellulosum]|uniref:Transcription regulator PadR N-terminal domain-containing protein n=1 Tax=Sorangium cellulosum TaxID=56 RepID=A0A4P2QB37_SORCE|nr:PadR family transcriptional regulator [Sorangium cellulosum]AUX26904.1 uncharacterized protein SOCEGT47_074740 [Sorangium cellulosum]
MSATIPDAVVLTLLMERPMHGYELIRELDLREVRDWAQISRPQVYYSLRKLANAGWIARTEDNNESGGPEREVYAVTETGERTLAEALDQEHWATEREVPRFVTWLALRHRASPKAMRKVITARRRFLQRELAKEEETLRAIQAEPAQVMDAAGLMVEFGIQRFKLELQWLDTVEQRLLGRSLVRSDRECAPSSSR